MVIVCDVCQSFASMNTQHILDHCSGCKAKCNIECMEKEEQEKAKRSPKDHKSGIPLNTFHPVQTENVSWCPFWICLASFLRWVLAQTTCHLFFQWQCEWCNGAYINCSIFCFNFSMFKQKTFNKSLTFIHSYKVFVSHVKLCSWVGDSNSSAPWHWRGQLEPFPPMFHWEFQVSLQSRISLPIWKGKFSRGALCGGCQEYSQHQC